MLLQFFTLKQRPLSLFSIYDQIDVKSLTKPQPKLSHKFKDCVRPMCDCGTEIETTKHFLLALPVPCQWKT